MLNITGGRFLVVAELVDLICRLFLERVVFFITIVAHRSAIHHSRPIECKLKELPNSLREARDQAQINHVLVQLKHLEISNPK